MLRERYESAMTLDAFIERAQVNQDLWRAMYRRAQAPQDLLGQPALPTTRHLLVLLENWCGDAVNTIPVVARYAEAHPQLELRVLRREENPDLMDAHLSGTARAIPVVLVLDENYEELGWWGSRPAELQRWIESAEGQAVEGAERYKAVRRWYARDRGRSAVREITRLLAPTAAARAA